MKKRVLAGIMMAVMMMASVMGVSAAGSKTEEVYASDASAKVYVVESGDQSLKDSAVKAAAGKTIITSTAVWNVKAVDGQTPTQNAAGKYEVQLAVTALTSSCSDVVVLCYNESAKTWSAVEAKVDYTNKTIDVALDSLGSIVICANVAAGGSTGTSPSTVGTSSAWMLWVAVAVVALGACVVVAQKKSRS